MPIQKIAQHGQAVEAPENLACDLECGYAKNILGAGGFGIAAQPLFGLIGDVWCGVHLRCQRGLQCLLVGQRRLQLLCGAAAGAANR